LPASHVLRLSPGHAALISGEVRHAFPSAERVLSVSDQQLRGCGIGFKAKTLRARRTSDVRAGVACGDRRRGLPRSKGATARRGASAPNLAVCEA